MLGTWLKYLLCSNLRLGQNLVFFITRLISLPVKPSHKWAQCLIWDEIRLCFSSCRNFHSKASLSSIFGNSKANCAVQRLVKALSILLGLLVVHMNVRPLFLTSSGSISCNNRFFTFKSSSFAFVVFWDLELRRASHSSVNKKKWEISGIYILVY